MCFPTAAVCIQGEIRLVGGADFRQGRVEVCNSNAWGTVCDDFFGADEATVACRQLGLNGDGRILLELEIKLRICIRAFIGFILFGVSAQVQLSEHSKANYSYSFGYVGQNVHVFFTGATAQSFAAYGAGTGQIVLDNIFCAGPETSLFDCPHNGVGTHDCSHFEDVGVTCPRKKV